MAEKNVVPISEVVRNLRELAYCHVLPTRRKQAIERLIELNMVDLPIPDTLSRELEAAHEPVGPH